MIVGVNGLNKVEVCDWVEDEYCLKHNIHVITEGFNFLTCSNVKDLIKQHESITDWTVEANPHIMIENVADLTEDNLDKVLAGMFEQETQRGEMSSMWKLQATASHRIGEVSGLLKKSLEHADVEAYLEVLSLMVNILIPLRKELKNKINLVSSDNRLKNKTSLFFELDLLDNADKPKVQQLLKQSGLKDGVGFFHKTGKTLKMLTRKEIKSDTVQQILQGKLPERELRETKLESCLIEIVYTLNEKQINYKVYAKGWLKLNKDETRYINLLHELKLEPWVDEMKKTVNEIDVLERMLKQTGYV
jgi:hypothetical protein